jgi:signal transduction histidine kinase
MTTNSDVLRSESFADVAQVIHRDVGLIVERWGQRATQEQPHGDRAHRKTLFDDLPDFLRQLANSLSEEGDGGVAHHHLPARRHGAQRWEAGWSLTEVVRDYQILRLVLVDYLEDALSRPLRSREHQAIGLALDEAISASVVAYSNDVAAQARAAEQERAGRAQQAIATLSQHTQELEEAHRHKDEFLAIMSHELRNPLAPLRNALHILSLDTTPATITWARQLMERQIHALTRLVEDLLNVSRLARGKITLQQERVDLARVVRETAEDRRSNFVEAGLELVVDTPAEPVWVQGESGRLVQVTSNLLDNARKFTDRGGQVHLTLTLVEPDQVMVTVRDTGIGIDLETLGRIFEPFAQGSHESESRRGGLGLGLALVKGLVELHGGRVEAHSEGNGFGAQFRFSLPRLPAEVSNQT